MKGENFAYWLQGYIEITVIHETPRMTEKQVECILKHLEMVLFTEKDLNSIGVPFALWLNGYLSFQKKGDLGVGNIQEIQTNLSKLFKHDIDPAAGDKETQDSLNNIHNKYGTLEQAIEAFGPQPFSGAKWNHLGWEHNTLGLMRC